MKRCRGKLECNSQCFPRGIKIGDVFYILQLFWAHIALSCILNSYELLSHYMFPIHSEFG
jgi:hypothetical protein